MILKNLPGVEPVRVSWRHWLRMHWHNRKVAMLWALRHPGSTIQRRTRLPWGRRAFALAMRTHLGHVDVRAMREAMMYLDEDELLGYVSFGPDPDGLDEMFEPASAIALGFDEFTIRNGLWDSAADRALAFRWMAKGDLRTAAWVRLRVDLADDRPPTAHRSSTASTADWPLDRAAATTDDTTDKETA